MNLQSVQSPPTAGQSSLQLRVGNVFQDEISQLTEDLETLEQPAHLPGRSPHLVPMFSGDISVLRGYIRPHPHLNQGGQELQPPGEYWEAAAEVKIFEGQRGAVQPLSLALTTLVLSFLSGDSSWLTLR